MSRFYDALGRKITEEEFVRGLHGTRLYSPYFFSHEKTIRKYLQEKGLFTLKYEHSPIFNPNVFRLTDKGLAFLKRAQIKRGCKGC